MKASYPRSFSARLVDEWTRLSYEIRLRFSPVVGLSLPSFAWSEWIERRRGCFSGRVPGMHVVVDWGRYRPFADRVRVSFSGSGWLPVARPGGFA